MKNLNIDNPSKIPDWLDLTARRVEYKNDGISIFSDFPCGNGQHFKRLAPYFYSFSSRVAREMCAYRFYMKIDGTAAKKEIKLRVTDFNSFDPPDLEQVKSVRISYDNETWQPLPDDAIKVLYNYWESDNRYNIYSGAYSVEYLLNVKKFPVWIASPEPYKAEQLKALLEFAAGHANVKIRSIGKSPCGLDIPEISIKNSGKKTKCKKIFLTGGQHPSETAGILAAEGAIREALENQKDYKNLDIVCVPILGMDGWLLGRTIANCCNESGCNLNRDWADLTQEETKAGFKTLKSFSPDIYIDCHNGRMWKEYRFQDFHPQTKKMQTLMENIKSGFKVKTAETLIRAGLTKGVSSYEAVNQKISKTSFIFENLLTNREDMEAAGRRLIYALKELSKKL